MQFVGNLLHAEITVFQHQPHFLHHIHVDPFVRRAPAHFLHHFEKIFWRDIHLLAVPAHVAFLAEMGREKLNKVEENRLSAGVALCGLLLLLNAEDGVAQVVDHRREKRLHDGRAEHVVLFAYFLFDALMIVLEGIGLSVQQMRYGMHASEHENGSQFVDIADDFGEELLTDDHSHALEIRADVHVGDDLFTTDDAEVVGTGHIVLRVAGVCR